MLLIFTRYFSGVSSKEAWGINVHPRRPILTGFFSLSLPVAKAMQKFSCLPWQPDLHERDNRTKIEKIAEGSEDTAACLIVRTSYEKEGFEAFWLTLWNFVNVAVVGWPQPTAKHPHICSLIFPHSPVRWKRKQKKPNIFVLRAKD